MANSLFAADYHVLPKSAGLADGSSWENAAAGSREVVGGFIENMQPGDAILFGSGVYDSFAMRIGQSGSEGNRLSFRGVDTGDGLPLMKSSFVKENPSKGSTFITIDSGASHLEFDGFRVNNYKGVVYSRGLNVDLAFSNFTVHDCRIGIFLEGGGLNEGAENNSHDIEITDSKFIGFTKSAVRLQNGNYNVKVENVFADAGGKEYSNDPFHMAFFVPGEYRKKGNSPADDHHITFINCEARNSYQDKGSKYWNGDGFVTESGTHHITYLNCRAYDHTDGGWDLKSSDTVLENCVAIGSKRNVRIWGDAKLINCFIGYSKHRGGSGGASGLYLTGRASVVVENSTILNNDGHQICLEKTKKQSAGEAKVIVKNSIVGVTTPSDRSLARVDKGSELEKIDSLFFQTTELNPGFVDPVADWDGQGTNFNNLKFGKSKGYYQK
ncbi:hypothetical protein GCM10007047_26690 [Cerasicoccus arenae]|uniref:Right handed beta helix domain-containing protein n=2 Tax=Cerasicoccus arenae TaxID=424488 RepID=A0A8J3GDP8_9BACT|nr:hypothetical protein GCM10007047_26690 [Cerasicoccus arenae]